MEAVPGPPPVVSVVVRTKERPGLLREALASLAAQTYREFEVVVVNDADAPLPAPPLEAGGAPVRIVSPGTPHGRARAANAGVEAACGTWVAYLDDDDLFLPDHLATLVEALEGQTLVQAAFTSALLVRQIRDADGTYREVSREPIFDLDFDADRLVFSNTIPLVCLMHRRTLFFEAGRFDEEFDLYEDWDFLLRLSRLTPFARVRKVTALYRSRDDETNVTSASPWRGAVSERAREALFRKHWGLHTPRAEMALLNLHEDDLQAWASREAAVREALSRAEEAGREERRLLDEQRRLVDEQRHLVNEQRGQLAEQARLLEGADAALAEERARGALERARWESERAALAESLAREGAERRRLDETVRQMTTSLAWRLFTPWWKLRAFLERKG